MRQSSRLVKITILPEFYQRIAPWIDRRQHLADRPIFVTLGKTKLALRVALIDRLPMTGPSLDQNSSDENRRKLLCTFK